MHILRLWHNNHDDSPNTAFVVLLSGMVGTSNASPERIFSRLTWQSRGRRSSMSMKRLDQVIRIQELGLPVKDQTIAFWRKALKELN